MTMATSSETVAVAYHLAGWHPIELPAGAKGPPPEGRTGYGGSDMTAEDIALAAWAGNIGVRMPVDVLGLDVDNYRGGRASLVALREQCQGVPLPDTWISHSGRNDGSGIRFYRVPTGMTWVASLPGIDIIQRGHRYAAVWPSTHPDGRPYGWWDQAENAPTEDIPRVEDLPDLPWAWIEELSRSGEGQQSRAVDLAGLDRFIVAHGERADQPGYITTIRDHFLDRWRAGVSRHDSMQHCLTWALECVRAGIATAVPTVTMLGEAWATAVAPDARRMELVSLHRTTEFDAMVRHAVGRVMAKTDLEILKIHDDIAGVALRGLSLEVMATEQIDVYPPRAGADDGDDLLPKRLDWEAFWSRDPDNQAWLVEDFWPWGRAMALWAAAKTGKSELALWCAAKLALGEHPWTGAAIDPVTVAYFDYEMTEDDLDDRLGAFSIDPRKLTRLHYFLLPALHALDGDQGGDEVERLAVRAEAQAVVFDTFGRAVGGDENDADTVRAFARYTGIRLKRRGIAYLRTDHAGKDAAKGQRGTSAKRDDVDVVWWMKRARGGGVDLDCSESSRLSWVKPKLHLDRAVVNGAVSYSAPIRMGWPAGTSAKVKELDDLGIPPSAGRPTVKAALAAAGLPPGDSEVLAAAIRFRKERAPHDRALPRDMPSDPFSGSETDSP